MVALSALSRPLRRPGFAAALIPARFKSTRLGKLGDPSMTFRTEPRANQAIIKHNENDLIMGKYGLVGDPLPFPFGPQSPQWVLHKYNEMVEKYVLPKFFNPEKMPMPDMSGIEQSTQVIKGPDGDIKLFITKPKGVAAAPGILHIHGGGMCFASAEDQLYRVWRAHLARRGFVVVGVEFRNSSGKLGRHPYPAGLNDCMSALAWTNANRAKLGISKLVISGESGGGNLSTAVAIRAKRDGKLHEFDGVFAMCPFIGGPELWKAKPFDSLVECDGYFVDIKAFLVCAKLYDPDENHLNDPCAWPSTAKTADLEGLPPHVISVNELDPLRDEGLAYYEKLEGAGVRVEKRIVEGTPHGGDMTAYHCPGAEYIMEDTIDSIMNFAESL